MAIIICLTVRDRGITNGTVYGWMEREELEFVCVLTAVYTLRNERGHVHTPEKSTINPSHKIYTCLSHRRDAAFANEVQSSSMEKLRLRSAHLRLRLAVRLQGFATRDKGFPPFPDSIIVQRSLWPEPSISTVSRACCELTSQ